MFMVCRSLFVLVCPFSLSVLFRLTDSDYLFGIFKLLLANCLLEVVFVVNVDLIKARFTEPFPSFATNTHIPYILRHCINVVIMQTNHINPLTFIFKIKY
jgi:hypothetical protein